MIRMIKKTKAKAKAKATAKKNNPAERRYLIA
jgi:hypothetical protein